MVQVELGWVIFLTQLGLVGLATQPNPKFSQPNPTLYFWVGCPVVKKKKKKKKKIIHNF